MQIHFARNGARYQVTLPHPVTAAGISAAVRIRRDLITKAEWGVLTEADLAAARGEWVNDNSVVVEDGVLFQEIAQKYLKHCEANTDSKKDYISALNKHWMPRMALIPIHDITSDLIRDIISDIGFKSDKTFNNCLVPLRGVFDKAIELRLITPAENPMSMIKNKKVQSGLPDPFTRDEMNALLNWLDKNLTDKDHFYYWYFEVAFWTGCRPSELYALRWKDIDWFNESVIINKSRVRGVEKQVTKTHTAREVYLNDRSKRAFEALEAMKLSDDYVMICPETSQPFYNEKPARMRLIEAMKATRVRRRPAYNARHTYATMLLMSDVNPVFVANQLGHSLQMLIKRYGRWLHGDQNKIEVSKLNTD
ncbi:tyrosine-type recombinase/integrase [Psychrobacter sp. Marseille-P5312]|uniref:tyrosine-type recombinase/integrase n=1 Tax=Psychrobacter sp. Marseille-P5312 TaxID=2086574 RepID=UPI001D0D0B26|nr:tyrosine-type recombinase/integrase [Psychrobacter sp. Marseille-P5312]